ncbi:MAG: helix-turn-helix transcriptional regulator [Clostridia bacterium]|nr:helix-turn-helix transcriptional regulator [Clostridia bacterium]
MENSNMGEKITSLRKEKGYTQKELADRMNVTDKAVSKWERGISMPDVGSLPRLAEVLGVSVDELLCAQSACAEHTEEPQARAAQAKKIFRMALRALSLAMGIAVAVLAALGELETGDGLLMLGIGMAALGIDAIDNGKSE